MPSLPVSRVQSGIPSSPRRSWYASSPAGDDSAAPAATPPPNCDGYTSPAPAPAPPKDRRKAPTRNFRRAAACRAPKAPQTHCADAGDPPAARREKFLPSEKVLETRGAEKSATPRKTSAGKESSPNPAHAAPSASPS